MWELELVWEEEEVEEVEEEVEEVEEWLEVGQEVSDSLSTTVACHKRKLCAGD